MPPPPPGFERARVKEGDTLASLAKQSGVADVRIAEANGVPLPPSGKKPCSWGIDVATWVLSTGGKRNPVDPRQPNNCEPGLGFPDFVDGQAVNLPIGLRSHADKSPPPPASTSTKSKVGAAVAGLALLAAGAAALKKRKKKGAAS